MPKRMKVKVEVEFECPDTGRFKPEEVFSFYFNNYKATCSNVKSKLLSVEKFKIPSQIDHKARKLNEYKRVFKLVLERSKFKKYLAIRAEQWSEITIDILIVSSNYPYIGKLASFSVVGQLVKGKCNIANPNFDISVNLANPDSIDELTRFIDKIIEEYGWSVEHLDSYLAKRNEIKRK